MEGSRREMRKFQVSKHNRVAIIEYAQMLSHGIASTYSHHVRIIFSIALPFANSSINLSR